MELAHRWGDRNLTRLELIIALLILALLIGFFSRYALIVFAQAERSMINRTVININTALNFRASMAVMNGENEELEYLLNMNPMEDMTVKMNINNIENPLDNYKSALAGDNLLPPSNYGGVQPSDNPDLMQKGKWYYILDNGLIVYTVNNTEFFESENPDLARIRFRIIINYKDINSNGQYDLKIDDFVAVRLNSIDNYTWLR